MNKAKRKLPRAIVNRIDKAQKAVTMSREKLPRPQPLIDLLETAMTATATLQTCADELNNAYGNLAAHVELAAGDEEFILGAGFDTWAKRALVPPFQDPTSMVECRMDKAPGAVFLAGEAIHGARLYQAQFTTDLTGMDPLTFRAELYRHPRVGDGSQQRDALCLSRPGLPARSAGTVVLSRSADGSLRLSQRRRGLAHSRKEKNGK